MPAHEVGLAILGPLRELDEVAYLRFASVYRQFESADDFEAEIALLRVEQEPTGIEPLIPDRLADNKISNFSPHRLTPTRLARPASSGDPRTVTRLRTWPAQQGQDSRRQATAQSLSASSDATADQRGRP